MLLVMDPIASPFRSTRTNDHERREKRDALLRAAARMFSERGFHATSLDEVAASLGVTKPVIYHHLGNKEKVLFECMHMALQHLLKAAADIEGSGGIGIDRLKRFLREYAEVIMGDFGRCVIKTDDMAVSAETRRKIRDLKSQVDAAIRSMIEGAVADGSARVDNVRVTAFALAGALNWSAVWHRPDKADSVAATADALVATLCAGIEPGAR